MIELQKKIKNQANIAGSRRCPRRRLVNDDPTALSQQEEKRKDGDTEAMETDFSEMIRILISGEGKTASSLPTQRQIYDERHSEGNAFDGQSHCMLLSKRLGQQKYGPDFSAQPKKNDCRELQYLIHLDRDS